MHSILQSRVQSLLPRDGLLGCTEGVEHGGSVLAEAEGEEETEGEAYDGADGCVH